MARRRRTPRGPRTRRVIIRARDSLLRAGRALRSPEAVHRSASLNLRRSSASACPRAHVPCCPRKIPGRSRDAAPAAAMAAASPAHRRIRAFPRWADRPASAPRNAPAPITKASAAGEAWAAANRRPGEAGHPSSEGNHQDPVGAHRERHEHRHAAHAPPLPDEGAGHDQPRVGELEECPGIDRARGFDAGVTDLAAHAEHEADGEQAERQHDFAPRGSEDERYELRSDDPEERADRKRNEAQRRPRRARRR